MKTRNDSPSPAREPRESGVSGSQVVFVPDNWIATIRAKTLRTFQKDAKLRAKWKWEPEVACDTREEAVRIVVGRLNAEIARAEKTVAMLRNRLRSFERREAGRAPETPHSSVERPKGERLSESK